MQEQKYGELEERAAIAVLLKAERVDILKRAEAEARVHDVISQMKAEGKAFVLTDEEERILKSFRRFKTTARKAGAVFQWQTAPLEPEVLIVDAGEAMHIMDPQDVSAG